MERLLARQGTGWTLDGEPFETDKHVRIGDGYGLWLNTQPPKTMLSVWKDRAELHFWNVSGADYVLVLDNGSVIMAIDDDAHRELAKLVLQCVDMSRLDLQTVRVTIQDGEYLSSALTSTQDARCTFMNGTKARHKRGRRISRVDATIYVHVERAARDRRIYGANLQFTQLTLVKSPF